MKKNLLALTALATLGLMWGCNPQENAAEAIVNSALKAQGVDAKIDADGENMTITGEDGKTVLKIGDQAAVPEGFPSDIHIPAGAKITSSMAMGTAFTLTLNHSTDYKALAAEYISVMTGKGWKKAMETQIDDAISLMFLQGENRSLNVSLEKSDSGTEAALIVGSK